MNYRQGNLSDINKFQELALKSWQEYQQLLTPDNWSRLRQNLTSAGMFEQLLQQSFSVVCLGEAEEVIGMSFLMPSGNPTDIYQNDWSYIRLVTVSPEYGGRGIGRQLTEICIQ